MDIERLKTYSEQDESLRDYQLRNKQKVYDAWTHCQSVMLQMPTGTGKTKLFVSIIKDIFHYSSDNKIALKVLILVHRTELIDQIDEELGYRYGLAHGIIQAGNKERKIYPIQLASVQTLRSRLNNWTDKDFDFIIVDEAHHIEADSYQKIIKAFPRAKLLGVTATPVRLSGEGFTGTFDELIISPSVKEFIDMGYLCQYEYYSVARSSRIQQEINDIKKFSNGDYAESELERVCDNDRIRAQVVQTYLDFANGKKGIVYTINKLHNKNLCEQFIEKGIKAVAIDSDTPGEIREQYIEQFRKGEYKIICNVNLFTEGFDCPDIEFVQLARPTKSLALYLQQVGRGLRISESKDKTLFLDNVGLYNRFGFPSSRRMWKHHFEGKYKGNKTIQEVEGEKKVDNDIIIKRTRHQNLEEGHEKIHLIQTTDERDYLEQRSGLLKDWITDVFAKTISTYNEAFKAIGVDGLGLTHEIKNGNFLQAFHLYIKHHSKDLEKTLETKDFYFVKYEDGKIKTKEWRRCKDYDELIEKLEFKLLVEKAIYFKSFIKEIRDEYKKLNFTKPELDDILLELTESHWSFPLNNIVDNCDRVHYIIILFDFYYNCCLKGVSYQKTFSPFMDAVVASIKT